MDWLFWTVIACVAVGIARRKPRPHLRPVAMINSADLMMCVRRSELERQASEAAS